MAVDVQYNRDIQDAVAGVDEAPAPVRDVITLSNGVQLRKKPFPILRVQAIVDQFKYPPVPEIWDEDRKRPIKNPDHPEYLRQKEEIDVERGMASIDAIIAFGTELVSVPEGIPRPDEER